ncbi:uncharacterized conserved small protein [Xenococcus sp. PCC 7305]|uniref:DUF2283 domain-containing protein n=1 Tax=Xenococcus sp. PCC 7305 TaxID=102125 RepID=UPI0002ABE790|nr:DUF2283 domain-containing protein [Xenococcus sp. PCC 7305]ELS04512.1 uncharacterized conserved small protein [Xenococcus sp. PCC 7305]
MSKAKMKYFEKEDIIHLTIADELEANKVEISSNITAELNEAGELVGIEITNASSFLRDSILEFTQEKIMKLVTSSEKSQFKYDFSDLAGKLNWQGDAVAMQRNLRDEW